MSIIFHYFSIQCKYRTRSLQKCTFSLLRTRPCFYLTQRAMVGSTSDAERRVRWFVQQPVRQAVRQTDNKALLSVCRTGCPTGCRTDHQTRRSPSGVGHLIARCASASTHAPRRVNHFYMLSQCAGTVARNVRTVSGAPFIAVFTGKCVRNERAGKNPAPSTPSRSRRS